MKSMKEELRLQGLRHADVLRAIDKAMELNHESKLPRVAGRGLCSFFTIPPSWIMTILCDLGGRSTYAYFWGIPRGRMNKAANQRLMMLAFLYEWTK